MEFSAPIPSGPQVARPKPAVLRITPLGFFLHARDFLEASVLLSEKRGRTTFVAAFLSCRAIDRYNRKHGIKSSSVLSEPRVVKLRVRGWVG